MGWSYSFLKPDEKILFEGNATKMRLGKESLAKGMLIAGITGVALSTINGRLFLTDKRLVLAKHLFLMFGTQVVEEITLRMVDAVMDVPDKLYNFVKIDTKDDKSHLFDVAAAIKENLMTPQATKEKWVEKINEALQGNN